MKQFSPELRFILHAICRADTDKAKNGGFTEIDIDKLVNLTEKHRITPLLFMRLNERPDVIDPRILTQLKSLSKGHAYKALALQSQLIGICREFNIRGVSYMAIKGPQLSHLLYSDACVRVCVDLDIFLEEPDMVNRASVILNRLGYGKTNLPDQKKWLSNLIFKTGKHEIVFFNTKTRTYIDLHLRPVGNSFYSARYHHLFFADKQVYTINGTEIYIPSSPDYFLFLCHHGAVHQYTSLHWLADVFEFYERYRFAIEPLIERAKQMRLKTHLALTLLLLNRICRTPVPDNLCEEWSRSRLMKRLYRVCIKSIQRTDKINYSLKERFEKTIYRFLLAGGFAGKADTLISVLLRYSYRILNKKGFKMREIKR